MRIETPIEEALSSVTDVLRAGHGEKALRRSAGSVPWEVLEPYVPLIRTLNQTYMAMEPSAQFVRRLRSELVAEQPTGLLSRVKLMPPRVQATAGTVAVLGFGLIVMRWLAGLFAKRSARTQPDTSR